MPFVSASNHPLPLATASRPGIHLRGHTPDSLRAAWPELRLDPGVARRLLSRVIFEDRDDLDGVRGLSKRQASQVVEGARLERLAIEDRRRSQVDPFVKYLFRSGAETFEAVRIPLEKPRYSVCVSSQAGCALGCAFCETGRLGFTRNLESWEIVEQVAAVRREAADRPVTGVVFQGQGEPFQNYDNVLRAASVLRDPCGLRIRGDRITISTVGLLPQIERFTEEGHPYRLILSLSSAFGEKRARLMPIGRTYDVPDLAAAMIRHARRRRAHVHLAWVLMAGVNTGPEEARELGRLFQGVPVRLSVIDYNSTPDAPEFRRADDEERTRFLGALAETGIGFVRRYSGGPDIDAACGLLASRARGGRALGASE
jgi:23S rRNA (adenine2503-C2)-methyltransferase